MFKIKSEKRKKIAFSLDENLVIELKKTTQALKITQRSFVEVAIKKMLEEIKEHKIDVLGVEL